MRWTLAALVAANVAPLLGVLAFGWRLGEVLLLFWAESAIVGYYGILRMARAARWRALYEVPFFVFHYGWFMFGHLMLVAVVIAWDGTTKAQALAMVPRVVPAATLLLVSHGVSFVQHVLKGGEQRDHVREMLAPYGRVALQHAALLFGAVLTVLLDAPVAAVALLVMLKTAADGWVHVRRHRKSAATHGAPEAASGGDEAGARV